MSGLLYLAELSRHSWPPRNRTAHTCVSGRPRRPAGPWPLAESGGLEPQRAPARPSAFGAAPVTRQVHSPQSGRWRIRISESRDPHPFSRRGPPPGGFISRKQRAEKSNLTPKRALVSSEAQALPGSLSVAPPGLEPGSTRSERAGSANWPRAPQE